MEHCRILYLGIPLGALALLRDGHDLVAACISRPAFPGMRRLRARLAQRAAPLFARPPLEDPEVQRILRSTTPDLVVSFFWHQRVPSAVRAMAQRAAFGVHPSLLPRHRGPDPYFWTLYAGDRETGVTAHLLDDGYDTGALLARSVMAVPEGGHSWRLALALDRPALALLRSVCRSYAEGAPPEPVPQDEALATDAPSPADDDLEIRWGLSSEEVLRLVRAGAPEPGAYSSFSGRILTVLAASLAAPGLEPGVAVLTREGVLVGTADRAVRLDLVRIDETDELLRGEQVAAALEGVSDLRGRP